MAMPIFKILHQIYLSSLTAFLAVADEIKILKPNNIS
jgi:hypothetical protein